ncbi:hypothetical protein BDR04DRAFT_1146860 [Suillus decipiens]|nr:hypothetical protein BDR04DRAFT_1146860 [Suillus decipiens]
MSELPLREVHSPINSPRKTLIVPLKMHLVALLAQTQGSKLSRFIDDGECAESNENKSEDKDDKSDESTEEENKITAQSSLLPGASIFHPHGSFPLPFKPAPVSSILLCTSVASRGLDLPLVHAGIQHNLPPVGGATEYVHKVGRTARTGKGGEALSIVRRKESIYFACEGMRDPSFEREAHLPCPTPSHHLAKAFALREAPKTITDGKNKPTSASKSHGSRPIKPTQHDVGDAEQRMQSIMRAQGRSKEGGKIISNGTDGFQIASGAALNSLVHAYRLQSDGRGVRFFDSLVFIRSNDVVTAYC